MRTNHRDFALTLATLTGGLLAAAFLPTAVATADTYEILPNITTFVPSQVEGYPPLINEVTGAEHWVVLDTATNAQIIYSAGTDTHTTIGSFINDDFLANTGFGFLGSPGSLGFDFPTGTQVDLANFGLGFENEWMDIPNGANAGISDLLITPFGNFELFGTGFSALSAVFTP